jgi:hypothetical protein
MLKDSGRQMTGLKMELLTANLSFPMARQPDTGLGLLIIEVPRSHSDTPQSVRLLRTSDQPDAETST